MDEISVKKAIKKAILIFAICIFVPIVILILAVIIYSIIKNENVNSSEIFSTFFSIIIGTGFVFLVLALIAYYAYHVMGKAKRIKNVITDEEKKYLREIPQEYTPAIASVLYDLSTETYRDYSATIINLCIKDYLKLIIDNNSYRLESIDKETNELKQDEIYVYNCIKDNNKFDEIEFRKIVFVAMEEMGLLEEVEDTENNNNEIIEGQDLLLDIINLYKTKKYRRTQKGEEVAKEFKALKNFIHDYTLIQEKEIDYYGVLEEYIPYALSLGEADFIEDMIKRNDKYRKIIYKY